MAQLVRDHLWLKDVSKAAIHTIRESLIAGDLRALYLLWLCAADDDNNDPALRAVHNLQDVVGCVGDATSEIFQMQTKANCQAAGKDATRALADIFHGRYGWSCDDLGIRVDQLLSYLPLPVEVGEMLNNMRKLVGKDPNDE